MANRPSRTASAIAVERLSSCLPVSVTWRASNSSTRREIGAQETPHACQQVRNVVASFIREHRPRHGQFGRTGGEAGDPDASDFDQAGGIFSCRRPTTD